MIVIPAGKFMMGATDADPADWEFVKPVHEVAVNSFEIGRYEVTQAQWKSVMGTYLSGPRVRDCMECPAHYLSWDDAQEFIRRLNQRTNSNYRLPTEAEWEYVARAGADYSIFLGRRRGKKQSQLQRLWQRHDSISSRVNAVGTFTPNAFGVFDMHGNV